MLSFHSKGSVSCLLRSKGSISRSLRSKRSVRHSNKPLSNIPSTTLTPLNPALTVSFASAISSAPRTSSNTAGTASLITVPSTIATETCPPAPLMPPMNPPTTAHPLPGSLVLVATSPFQSRTYSASPSPSPSLPTKTTPPLVYPDNLMQAALPTLRPPMCQSSSTSHWGNCLPSQYGMPSRPPTWAHPRSAPLSMPSWKLRTAVIRNMSATHGPKPQNPKRP